MVLTRAIHCAVLAEQGVDLLRPDIDVGRFMAGNRRSAWSSRPFCESKRRWCQCSSGKAFEYNIVVTPYGGNEGLNTVASWALRK